MTKTNTLKVSVTADDIDNGIGRDCQNCPISIAILRALPRCHWSTEVYFVYEGLGVTGRLEITQNLTTSVYIPSWKLPSELEEFAMQFDDWSDRQLYETDEEYFSETEEECVPEKPEPFEFEIDLSREVA